jgi:hypothetical protein
MWVEATILGSPSPTLAPHPAEQVCEEVRTWVERKIR